MIVHFSIFVYIGVRNLQLYNSYEYERNIIEIAYKSEIKQVVVILWLIVIEYVNQMSSILFDCCRTDYSEEANACAYELTLLLAGVWNAL